MKKQILAYLSEVKAVLEANAPDTDWGKTAGRHLTKIGFYQHERLIHLIVTVLFALLEVISVATAVITSFIGMLVLSAALLVLLVPYIGHYYFLENSVQELYLLYDQIVSRQKGA